VQFSNPVPGNAAAKRKAGICYVKEHKYVLNLIILAFYSYVYW
jgi:hypothetical protein